MIVDAAVEQNAWREVRWTLRADVRAMTRPNSGQGSGEVSFVLEDSLQTRFYEIGHAEYLFVSKLDGKLTVSEALLAMPSEHRLNIEQARQVVHWLVTSQLVRLSGAAQGVRLHQMQKALRRREVMQRVNPLSARLPLARPDALLQTAAQKLRWLASWRLVVLTLLVAAIAAYFALGDWQRIRAAARGVASPERWLWIALCWLVLKGIHEFAHGIVCRIYGGNVREAGRDVALLLPRRLRGCHQLVAVSLALGAAAYGCGGHASGALPGVIGRDRVVANAPRESSTMFAST